MMFKSRIAFVACIVFFATFAAAKDGNLPNIDLQKTCGVRAKASAELAACGELVVPLLKARLKEKVPLEAHRRIEALLTKLDVGEAAPERLRTLRAVTVLEILATPAAQNLLQELAHGAPQARLTREAKAALRRSAKGAQTGKAHKEANGDAAHCEMSCVPVCPFHNQPGCAHRFRNAAASSWDGVRSWVGDMLVAIGKPLQGVHG